MPEAGELDEFDVRHFRTGGIFTVPARLGSMLIISGHAELIEEAPARAEVSDFGQLRFPRRK